VLIGRPFAYGLAVRGEPGVRDVLHNLLAELDLTMSLAGCARFADAGRDSLVRHPAG
jgi:isopentenyl diphosphate isomerase/L-lactate dehydrogenase-like FMN-dependent dehydrogenase